MKIAMIVKYDAGGTHNMATPIVEVLKRRGHSVDYGTAAAFTDRSLADFDIAHFWNLSAFSEFQQDIAIPFSVTIHHMEPGSEGFYVNGLRTAAPRHIHVVDRFAQRQLGQHGIYNTTYIPQAINQSLWAPLMVPPQFTIGYVGGGFGAKLSDRAPKRFDAIDEMAKRLDIECIGHAPPEFDHQKSMRDVYEWMSVYVVASFNEAGPLPAQEALLCGRPVVTTWVGAMPHLIYPGANGEFFDGSIEDGMRAIQRVRENYMAYRNCALATRLPDAKDCVSAYEEMFRKIVNEG